MPHSMIHPLTSFIFRAGRKIFPFKMMNDDFSHFYISVSSFFLFLTLSLPIPLPLFFFFYFFLLLFLLSPTPLPSLLLSQRCIMCSIFL